MLLVLQILQIIYKPFKNAPKHFFLIFHKTLIVRLREFRGPHINVLKVSEAGCHRKTRCHRDRRLRWWWRAPWIPQPLPMRSEFQSRSWCGSAWPVNKRMNTWQLFYTYTLWGKYIIKYIHTYIRIIMHTIRGWM